MTKILTTEVTKPVEVASEARLRVLADVLRYALTMFIRDSQLMDYKLVYAVLGCINLVSAKKSN